MSQAGQMVKHSTIYAIGNVSRQLVGFIMLPVYTHYLTPADYGVIGLLIFLVSLFEILLGGHMFQAVPKFYHQQHTKTEKNSVVTTALLVTSSFSLIACFAMSTSSGQLSEIVFGDRKYSIYILIFSALILTHALEQYGLTYLRIIKKPWTYFTFSMIKLALQVGFNILTIVILNLGLMGLAISSLISSALIALTLCTYTIVNTGFNYNRKIAYNILRFSWPLWVSGLIGLYIGSSNRYFIRIFSSLDDVGLFELAAKFGSIVSILVWLPFSQYWQTERFAIAKSKNPYPAYSLAFRLISGLLLISGIGINISVDIIVKIMSDSAFLRASDAVPFLVIAGIFQCLTIFNNFSFMFQDKTLEVTKNNAATGIIVTALYFILIPSFGFIGASIAFAGASIFQYIYALRSGNRIYPLKIDHKPLIFAFSAFLIATILGKALTGDQFTFENVLLKLVIIAVSTATTITILANKSELALLFSSLRSRILKKK